MANQKLNITDLDFDEIKDGLKRFLQSHPEFTDYNFDGSGWSVIINLLAANTHYNSLHTNMVSSEMMLDTATRRDSVVLRAKEIGYVPRSMRSARAVVDVIFSGEVYVNPLMQSSSGYIPSGTVFSATTYSEDMSKKYSIEFLTRDAYEVVLSTKYGTPQWLAENVVIYEGSINTYSYVADNTIRGNKYVIPAKNVDIDTLVVRVSNSITDNTGYDIPWTRSTNIVNNGPTSKVYYIQENSDGNYEVYFGDNILGALPEDGNLISFEYLVTQGTVGNGVGSSETSTSRSFKCSISANSTVIVTSVSSGGDEKETIENIKYYAPLVYNAQNRAVTADDYKALVAARYPSDSVFVWGGEENDPPQAGSVFISIKPKSGTSLSSTERLSLSKQIIKERNTVGVEAVIVDPDYIYLLVDAKVTYNPRNTVMSSSELKALVQKSIKAYTDTTLEKFEKNFRYSQFIQSINEIDPSIISNDTTIKLQKRFEPIVPSNSAEIKNTIKSVYNLDFGNALYHPIDGFTSIISSSMFKYYDSYTSGVSECYLDDDGYGIIRIYTYTNGVKRIVVPNAGTVNYTTGMVSLKSFGPVSVTNTVLRVTAIPGVKDVISHKNQIILIDKYDINNESIVVGVILGDVMSGSTVFPYRS
jgi:hypothetical protein